MLGDLAKSVYLCEMCWPICWYIGRGAERGAQYTNKRNVYAAKRDSRQGFIQQGTERRNVGKEADGGELILLNGKNWRLYCRFGGKQKTFALGVYPAVSLLLTRRGCDYRQQASPRTAESLCFRGGETLRSSLREKGCRRAGLWFHVQPFPQKLKSHASSLAFPDLLTI